MSNIVVLGAGVSGLTSALQLARNGNHKITIIAKYMPGDYDIEYASPWAGADYVPNLAAKQAPKKGDAELLELSSMGKPEKLANKFERDTWPELERLARDLPEAGIHFQEARILRRGKDAGSITSDWFEALLKDDADPKIDTSEIRGLVDTIKQVPKSELPPGHDTGISFMSVCINTALYLPWLASQCLEHGVVIRRGIATHVADAADMHHSGKRADLIVNCTGLSSLRLGGVEDKSLYPGRGQIVVVRNVSDIMYAVSGTDDGSDESTYMMNRAAGGGLVLGGCMQRHNWESQPDINLANRIMKRCVDLCPDMVPNGKGIEGLSIVRHGVGLRPMREDGIRVAKEVIKGIPVVHNYGHGGYGYQTSYGAAEAVMMLVYEALKHRANL